MDTAITIIWPKGCEEGWNHRDIPAVVPESVNLFELWTFSCCSHLSLWGNEHSGCLSYILQQKTTVLVLAMVALLHLVLCHAGIFVIVAGPWKVSPLVFHAVVIFFIYLSIPYRNLELEEKVASFFSIHYLHVHPFTMLELYTREKSSKKWSIGTKISHFLIKKKKPLENVA